MNISLLEPLGIRPELLEELAAPLRAAGHTFTAYDQKAGDTAELARRSKDCDIVMIANTPYPKEAVCAAKHLQMIDVAFTGVDHVALDACREKGVTVCNAANYSNETVAELVIGMSIALLRNMKACDGAVRGAGTSAGLMGREIAGRTVGVIGTGHIGMIVAKLFLAFGAEVVACSRHEKEEAVRLGIRYLPLDELMRVSDIVTLHTPNNASTRGMISREKLALMKPTALFINCARGPIVDAQALADALNAGHIAGAGIDVFDVEPPIPASEPLLTAKNTILTPHVAFLSEEAMIRRAHIAFENLTAYLSGVPQNVCEL